jgi:predicted dehydrogenase
LRLANGALGGLIADLLGALDQGRAPRAAARPALPAHQLIEAVLRSAMERRLPTKEAPVG